jgi:orotidine-5'-phosphate decarboxylase
VTGFADKLAAAVARNRSLVCVGLDPDPRLAPAPLRAHPDWLVRFNMGIVEATADLVCAYKPNLAFYEALGRAGLDGLRATLAAVPRDVPVVLDAKRGDIGHTAAAYATALFDDLGADAITVSPYLGFDALEPFLVYRDRGVFVLCKTSNPGAAEFQDLLCEVDGARRPLYEVVARAAVRWSERATIGLVVGATHPETFRVVRAVAPDLPLLVPGVGAQGGDLATAVRAGLDTRGAGLLVAASRAVLYASSGGDWQAAARAAAEQLRDTINLLREAKADGAPSLS